MAAGPKWSSFHDARRKNVKENWWLLQHAAMAKHRLQLWRLSFACWAKDCKCWTAAGSAASVAAAAAELQRLTVHCLVGLVANLVTGWQRLAGWLSAAACPSQQPCNHVQAHVSCLTSNCTLLVQKRVRRFFELRLGYAAAVGQD